MWFKRSDGVMFSASEDSASFKMMSKDGSFEQQPSDEQTDAPDNKTAKTLDKKRQNRASRKKANS